MHWHLGALQTMGGTTLLQVWLIPRNSKWLAHEHAFAMQSKQSWVPESKRSISLPLSGFYSTGHYSSAHHPRACTWQPGTACTAQSLLEIISTVQSWTCSACLSCLIHPFPMKKKNHTMKALAHIPTLLLPPPDLPGASRVVLHGMVWFLLLGIVCKKLLSQRQLSHVCHPSISN